MGHAKPLKLPSKRLVSICSGAAQKRPPHFGHFRWYVCSIFDSRVQRLSLPARSTELGETFDSSRPANKHLNAAWIAHNVGLFLLCDPNLTWLHADRTRKSWPIHSGSHLLGHILSPVFRMFGLAPLSQGGFPSRVPAKLRCRFAVSFPVKFESQRSETSRKHKCSNAKRYGKVPEFRLTASWGKDAGTTRSDSIRDSGPCRQSPGNSLRTIWDTVGKQLLQANSKEEVIRAFETNPITNLSSLRSQAHLEGVVREKNSQRRRQAQINFLADSLAGRDWISPRRSRDICEEERKKPTHHIIRQDFYIECSCGYEGPAYHKACPKCGRGEFGFDGLSFLFLIFSVDFPYPKARRVTYVRNVRPYCPD